MKDLKEKLRFIEGVSDIINSGSVSEVEMLQDEFYLKVSKVNNNITSVEHNIPQPSSGNYSSHSYSDNLNQSIGSSEDSKNSPKSTVDNANVLKSPTVGIIYLAPDPESPDFVSVGSTVEKGDTIVLVEAMKVFNQVIAHKSGVIKEIYVDNNAPVEFDDPIALIE